MKERSLKYLETQNLYQDALENTFDAIHLHCGSNNKPSVGQFVYALKTVIGNGLTYRGLLGPNCENDGATLRDNLHSFLKPSSVSSPSVSQQVMTGRLPMFRTSLTQMKLRNGCVQPFVLLT